MSHTPNPYATLRSAAKYVRQFRHKTFVVKLGGELLDQPNIRKAVAEQLALLWSFSIQIVIVHGGGSSLDQLCESMDLPIAKVGGRRITSPAVLDAAKMAFAGKLHMDLLADLRAADLPCVGLSGVDAGLVNATRRPPVFVQADGAAEPASVDFGLVGDIQSVDPSVLTHLLQGGFVPVIAPLTGDDDGAIFNTNADTLAAAVAVALKAEKLFFLLKVPGLLADVKKPSSLVPLANLEKLAQLEQGGAITAGMRPKLEAAKKALAGGVPSVHLVSGLAPDALLTEVFTNEGSGTMIAEGHAGHSAAQAPIQPSEVSV